MSQKVIISKTPHRICLTGGTDLIPYVRRYGGDSFGATIDKFVTVAVSRRQDGLISLKYPSGSEQTNNVASIQNPIIRRALMNYRISGGVNIISVSDVPVASGLGSSGAFTVGLLNALSRLEGRAKPPRVLAEEAAHLEINQLKAPIGKHDQYMAAYGGFLHLIYKKRGGVSVKRINLLPAVKKELADNLVLVFSGLTRSASQVHSVTAERFKSTSAVFADISGFKNTGAMLRRDLVDGRVGEFGHGLKTLLAAKKKCFVNCTNGHLDKLIETGYALGAVGAKVIGAGAGGFIYFYVPKIHQPNFKRGIIAAGGTIYPFSFVAEGSRIVG